MRRTAASSVIDVMIATSTRAATAALVRRSARKRSAVATRPASDVGLAESAGMIVGSMCNPCAPCQPSASILDDGRAGLTRRLFDRGAAMLHWFRVRGCRRHRALTMRPRPRSLHYRASDASCRMIASQGGTMAPTTSRSLRVPVKKLRRACDPRSLKFKTTAELAPIEGTVGQDRAVSALDFGLSIEAEGFNVYVAGPPGTGRSTEVKTQLARIAATRPPPRDWCYVFNFRDPSRPQALSLPPDRGHQLSHDVDELIEAVRLEVPRAFESDEYVQRRDQVGREVQAQRERFFEALEKEAHERDMAVNVTPMGITTVPTIDGKPITKEQYDLLTDERKHELQGHTAELDSIIAQMAPQLRRLDRGAHLLVAELDKQVMKAITSPRLEELKRDFRTSARPSSSSTASART